MRKPSKKPPLEIVLFIVAAAAYFCGFILLVLAACVASWLGAHSLAAALAVILVLASFVAAVAMVPVGLLMLLRPRSPDRVRGRARRDDAEKGGEGHE